MRNEILATESLTTIYRPMVMDDLYGQDHIVSKLKGMIKLKKVPSAILISGKSGCGKTTLANIINRYLNCDDNSACGECESCKKVTSHPDFISFNIGDTRGIDDIRAIAQSSKISPRYKKRILMLDECHQMTVQAANSLLVPLENPSKNTVWILSTTNPEKLLPAILGRCHRFDIRPIDSNSMRQRLFQIAKSEGVNLKKVDGGIEALDFLISISNGQMRDGIQMLESLIFALASGEKIDAKSLLQKYVVNFSADIEQSAAELLHSILSKSMKRILKAVLTTSEHRQVLSKMRWLIQYMLAEYAGVETYKPYTLFKFLELKKKKDVEISHVDLLLLQSTLTSAEITMNSGIDPQIVLMSAIGDYVKEVLRD